MPIPEIPPIVTDAFLKTFPAIQRAIERLEVAILTSAVVSTTGHPVSIQSVLDIRQDIYWSLHPSHGHSAYEAWAKTKDETLMRTRA